MIDWISSKVAVLGGGGFLGSHIVAELRLRGVEAIVPRTERGWDFRDPTIAAQFFREHTPDIVFNCAARQGGIEYQRLYPADLYRDNLLLGLNCLDAACHGGVRKYINVVAACSYPGFAEGSLGEEDYWSGPLHPSVVNYGFTKKAQVVQGECYRRQFGFNSIHLLMTNLYGPGEHFHPDRSHGLAALLLKFYEAKRFERSPVSIWGSGDPVREWLFVDDAVQAILAAAERYDDAEPINVSVGEGLTIRALADLIASVVGYEGEVVYDRDKPDGALYKTFRNGRLSQLTGWAPSTPLRVGIERTLDWLAHHYEDAIRER